MLLNQWREDSNMKIKNLCLVSALALLTFSLTAPLTAGQLHNSVSVVSVAPTTRTFLSGSGTYTTPAAVKWIKVFQVGAGGGGAGGGTGSGNNGGNGGDTCWNTTGAACTTPVYKAGGGLGAISGVGAGGAGGTVSGSGTPDISVVGSIGGPSVLSVLLVESGGDGGPSCIPGNGLGGINSTITGTAGTVNSGGGGGGGGSTNTFDTGAGGGGGACTTTVIGKPASSYTYAVGVAGVAGTGGSFSSAGNAGGSGEIIVEEHYNY